MTKDYVFELNIPYINIDVKDFENHEIIKASFQPRDQMVSILWEDAL